MKKCRANTASLDGGADGGRTHDLRIAKVQNIHMEMLPCTLGST